jgi:predicted PurR-regulated permease PerM
MVPIDFMRYLLSVVTIAGLLFLSGWVLLPFMAAGVWAAMIVVATWPLMLGLQRMLGGSRVLATLVMTLAIVLLLVIPLWLAVTTVIEHSDAVRVWVRELVAQGLPPAPAFVGSLPVLGDRLLEGWNDLATHGTNELFHQYVGPHLTQAGQWALGHIGGLGGVLISFFLMTLISAVMYMYGEQGATLMRRLGERLGGERGRSAVTLSAQAIRSVALGVFVTALVQSLLGTIVLAMAGIPYAGFLGALMLLLCIAQIGPSVVLVPAVVWMFWQGDSLGWSIFLAVASVPVIALDNFMRPWLIKRGADLPLLLVLLGVIGGLLTFGLIGIFVGPVVLAVTYTLMMAWLADGQAGQSD